jgi:hypothetical protein
MHVNSKNRDIVQRTTTAHSYSYTLHSITHDMRAINPNNLLQKATGIIGG